MNNIRISAIVPVYKVEKFLDNCLSSILHQTLRDFEIIVVDDGSPDNSGKIADAFAKKDDRVKVFHIKNGGVVKAREFGVNQAHGEWITFIDSDDSITMNAFENLMNSVSDNTDIVIGFPTVGNIPTFPEPYTIDDYRSDLIGSRRVPTAPWAKLIRKSILTPFVFDIPRLIKRGDDLLFNIRCAFSTDKAPSIVRCKVYEYFENTESIVHTTTSSPEFEETYFQYKLASIPTDYHDKFMLDLILDRFHPIQWWSYHKMNDTTWMTSKFVEHLKRDLKKYNFHLNSKQKILFNNSFLRVPLLMALRLKEHVIS